MMEIQIKPIRIGSTTAEVAGQILAQDLLIRKMLIQISYMQSLIDGKDDMAAFRPLLTSWLTDMKAQIKEVITNMPEADELKHTSVRALNVYIGDAVKLIDDDATGLPEYPR
jgi:hypothetical protein